MGARLHLGIFDWWNYWIMAGTKDKLIQDKKAPLMNFEELHENYLTQSCSSPWVSFFLSFFLIILFFFWFGFVLMTSKLSWSGNLAQFQDHKIWFYSFQFSWINCRSEYDLGWFIPVHGLWLGKLFLVSLWLLIWDVKRLNKY